MIKLLIGGSPCTFWSIAQKNNRETEPRGPGAGCDIRKLLPIRRFTPTECARLQGMPDWWCADIPHADSAEYKMWGNGMALPNALYVMDGFIENNTAESGEEDK